MTRVKICGIRTLHEAKWVMKAGAWALGEVFAESPRRIEAEKAAKINRQIGNSILKIGVFVDEDLDLVKDIVRSCKLDMVQLHGTESPEYAAEIEVPVIKSFSLKESAVQEEIRKWPVYACLFDSYSASARGGTGKGFDWRWLDQVKGLGSKIILAGGLNAGNAGTAIRTVHPMALDVSSGLEYPQGGKNPAEIIKFIKSVKETDQQIPIDPDRLGSMLKASPFDPSTLAT